MSDNLRDDMQIAIASEFARDRFISLETIRGWADRAGALEAEIGSTCPSRSKCPISSLTPRRGRWAVSDDLKLSTELDYWIGRLADDGRRRLPVSRLEDYRDMAAALEAERDALKARVEAVESLAENARNCWTGVETFRGEGSASGWVVAGAIYDVGTALVGALHEFRAALAAAEEGE